MSLPSFASNASGSNLKSGPWRNCSKSKFSRRFGLSSESASKAFGLENADVSFSSTPLLLDAKGSAPSSGSKGSVVCFALFSGRSETWVWKWAGRSVKDRPHPGYAQRCF